MLTLENIIKSASPEIEALIKTKQFKIVRHVMSNRKDGNWERFDEHLKYDKNLLLAFTSEQSKDRFKGAKLMLIFVAETGTRCILRGSFWLKGSISRNEWGKLYPEGSEKYEQIKIENSIQVKETNTRTYYELQACKELESLENRLVIDWGKSAANPYQSNLKKEVWQILPKGFIEIFPGWEKVLITHQRLKQITSNPDGNQDWHKFLSEHDGVYVIRDMKTDQTYVGSAYSKKDYTGGLWGRLLGYAITGNNGNKGLVELTLDPNNADHFVYSIHYVVVKSPKSAGDVRDFEQLLKDKIGSKLNHN